MIQNIQKLISYLVGKKDEIQDLDLRDALMAKVILDIHRTRFRKEFIFVPLGDLKPIHTLDRPSAIQATEERVQTLEPNRERFLTAGRLTRTDLAEIMPSVSWIKVVREDDRSFVAFEGNGRLAALHRVFGPDAALEIEVELYHFRKPRKIVRRLNRLRRLNGLL
jgi:hypothetical protein